MNRPLVWAAMAYALGIAVARAGGFGGAWPGVLLFVLGGVVAVYARRLPRGEAAAVALCFAAAGMVLWEARHGGPPGDGLHRYAVAHADESVTLEGRVRTAPVLLPGDDYAPFVVDVCTHLGTDGAVPLAGRAQLAWSGPRPGLRSGDHIRFTGRVTGRLGPVNHGLHDAEDHLRGQGVYTRVRVRGDDLEVLARSPWHPAYWASCLRQWQADALRRAMPARLLPLVRALWLGDRGVVDPALAAALRDSGTAHILTVSGVHVGIVALSLGAVLPVWVRSRRKRAVLVLAGVVTFAMASGMRPSTLRATLMVATYLAADLFRRERDAPTALALSALVLLTIDPAVIAHTGFILSFLSVGAILVFADPIRERMAWLPRAAQGPVAASLAVSVLAWPLSAHYFHVLPLVGPLVNLLVVPLVTVLLWLCLATVLVAALLPPAAMLFGHAALPFSWLVEATAKTAAALPLGHFSAPPPAWPAVLCWAAAVYGLHRALRVETHAARWGSAAATAAGLALLTWNLAPQPAGVHFLDVGQSDAAFIRTPGGTTLIIDAGDATEYTDMGERVVAPFLRAHGVRHVDYAVLTHPDRDHIGGYFYLLDAVSVGAFILPQRPSGAPLEEALLAACAARGIPVRRVARGDRLVVEGATAEVLHPPAGWGVGEKVNEHSVVLRLAWPGMSVLFAGDVEDGAEAELAGLDCRADILKVPHHGSHTSSSAAFLDAAAPRHAVCSTTRAPDHVLGRYRERGIALLRTDHAGGVAVTVKSGTPVFRGARLVRGYSLAPPE